MKNKTLNAAGKKTTSKNKPTRKTATKAQSGVSANPETRISATIDIGFGNILYLRGDALGPSWEHGVPMDCSENSTWSWSTTDTAKQFTYKLLVNDISWSMGEDYTAHTGQDNNTSPKF